MRYRVGEQVEYYSRSRGEWVPAEVTFPVNVFGKYNTDLFVSGDALGVQYANPSTKDTMHATLSKEEFSQRLRKLK